ncbi:hypothetical protein [Bradyrhizobium sp. 170]|uniref:hypothetical protein n=1 Tax=Bradyrhizobium sp. 170 TaxID=2782641 RepID=UPI001FFF2D53|nr:hypothetical protein [Bradyrhizobium sp. 170]UPK02828.1 hypothetical protein IVB05_35550 [Bradyrhizobium sp. 170]
MKLYQASATTNRGSIRKKGLLLEVPPTPPDSERQHSPTGAFFFCTKLPKATAGIDVWEELDATGPNFVPDDTDIPFDPEDDRWALYGHEVVDVWQLSLLGEWLRENRRATSFAHQPRPIPLPRAQLRAAQRRS